MVEWRQVTQVTQVTQMTQVTQVPQGRRSAMVMFAVGAMRDVSVSYEGYVEQERPPGR